MDLVVPDTTDAAHMAAPALDSKDRQATGPTGTTNTGCPCPPDLAAAGWEQWKNWRMWAYMRQHSKQQPETE